MAETTSKQVYIIVATKSPEAIFAKIREFGLQFTVIKGDAWFVTFNGTTRQLAEKLGIRNGEVGSGVVVGVQSYSGRAASEIWEWLKLNWPKDG